MAKEELDLIRFEDNDVSLDVSVSPKEQTVWLTQEQMAKLFERSRSIITRHLRRIFESKELDEISNVRKTNFANSDKPVALYNLDVILSVGYRVNSKRGVQFRRWATSVLKELLLQGYSIATNRALITDDNYRSLVLKVDEIGNQVALIHGRLLSVEETIKKTPPERIFYEGALFDAFEFLSSLIAQADSSIVFVDPYLDDKALSFFTRKKAGVTLDIYLLAKTRVGEEALRRFNAEYGQLSLHETSSFHDRYLILDKKIVYAIGPSLNHAGRKTFGVYRMEDEQTIADLVSRLAIL
jgi:hypothetical protein